MRKKVHKVFDDFVTSDVRGITSIKWNDFLGSCDNLGFEVAVDQVTDDATVAVWIEHSSDALNWLVARDVSQTDTPGDVRLELAAGAHEAWQFADVSRGVCQKGLTANGPLLGFVRLMITISAGQAHVKIHAFHRDGS